jgi:hypothetical protein
MINKINSLIKIIIFLLIVIYLFLSSHKIEAEPIFKTYSYFFFVFLFGLTSFLIFLNPVLTKSQCVLIIFNIFLFFLNTIGTLYSYNSDFYGLINNFVIQLLIIVFIISLINSRIVSIIDLPRSLAHLLIFLAFLSAIIGWALLMDNSLFSSYFFSITKIHNERMIGFYSSPNELGLILAFGLIVSIYLATSSKAVKKLYYYQLALFFMLSLFASGSRGSIIIGILGVVTFFTLFNYQNFNIKFLLNNIFSYLTIFLIIELILISQLEFFSYTFNGLERLFTKKLIHDEIFIDGRIIIFINGIQHYLNGNLFQLVFGFGNSAFENLIINRSPHNSFLRIIFDHGLISFLLVLLYIGTALKIIILSNLSNIDKSFFLGLNFISLFRGFFQSGEIMSASLNWSLFNFIILTVMALKSKEKTSLV